jgi:hypothetical protein
MGQTEAFFAHFKVPFDVRFFSLTAVMADLNVVDAAVQRLLARVGPSFDRSLATLNLDSIYEVEPPRGGTHLFKVVLFAPVISSASTIIVTNLMDGWSSLSYNLAKEIGVPQIQVTSTGVKAQFSQQMFEFWRDGVSSRVVMVMRDSDEWVFFERGDVEAFEDSSLYAQRLKRRRLTRESLVNSLRKLGWDTTNSLFWQSNQKAIYFDQTHKKRIALQ